MRLVFLVYIHCTCERLREHANLLPTFITRKSLWPPHFKKVKSVSSFFFPGVKAFFKDEKSVNVR